MPVLLLLALFVVVPIVEIYVIIQVGQEIGAAWTVVLLIAMSFFGAWILRREGGRAWTRFRDTVAAGRVPAREVADGALVIFGGALLLTPGFVTDIFGAAFLLPPTRAVIRRLMVRRYAGRLIVAAPGSARRRPPRGPGADVDSTATEVDPRSLP